MSEHILNLTHYAQKFTVEGTFERGCALTADTPGTASNFFITSVVFEGDNRELLHFLDERHLDALESLAVRHLLSPSN